MPFGKNSISDLLVDWTPGLDLGGLAGAMYGGQEAGEGQDKRGMEHGLTFGIEQRSEILSAFIQFVLDITQGLENIYTDRLNVREP